VTAEMLGRLTFYVLFPFIVMAIVGGIYYLFARPRVTFVQAMFRWWVVLIGVGMLFLSLLGQMARAL
jgi:hypothetical protein